MEIGDFTSNSGESSAPNYTEKDVVEHLVAMYSCTNTEERNVYYKSLVNMSNDRLNFIKTILSIIAGQYQNQEKLSVVLFFKSFLNNLIIKRELTSEERKSLYEELVKIMFEGNLSDQLLSNLGPCLESILFFDESDTLNTQHLLECHFQNMMRYINEDVENTDVNVLRVFFSMYRVAVSVIQDVETLSEKMKQYNEILCQAAEKIIVHLKQSFINSDIESAQLYSTSLMEWTLMSKECLNKLCKNAKEFENIDYMTTDAYVNVVYEIIFIAGEEEAVFFESGDDKINESLYASKSNMIKIMTSLMTIIRPHLHYDKLKETGFMRLLSNSVNRFLDGILKLGENPDNEDLLENQKMKDCVANILAALSLMLYIKEFHESFQRLGIKLITDIGFPFLRTMRDEVIEMHDNPAEFVKLALDTCDRQKYLQIKSQAGKFLETLGDKMPGIFESMCLLNCDILEYAINKDPDMDKYPTLKMHYSESKFFTYCTDENLIDCSLLVLTMISYALPKAENLKLRFIKVVENVTKPLMERNSLLLNCRLTIMLGYYIDILYKENEVVFLDTLKMFIGSLRAGPETYALAYQSSDTLNTIINDNDIIPRIKPVINEIFQEASDCILTVKIPDFFDFVSEIFRFYKDEIQEVQFVRCLKALVQRIEIDIQETKGDAKEKNPFQNEPVNKRSDDMASTTSMAIQKCWTIIITVLENETYIEKFLPVIESELKYLFGMLCDANRIEFDDDIVKSMKILITKSNGVSDIMKALFPFLKNTFEKHKFMYSELFELIKAYCKYDKQFLYNDPKNVESLFGYGVQTIYNSDHTINGAVYLIQMFLMLKTEQSSITDKIVPEVLENVLKRMKEKPKNRVIKRLMFGIILSAMVSNFNATFQFLENNNLSHQVMESVLKFSVKNMDNLLERKLYSMSLTTLLTQAELPDTVRDKSPRIISKIVDILVKTSLDEAKKARKKQNSSTKDPRDEDLDSDFDSEFESSESERDSEDDHNQTETPDPQLLGANEDEEFNQDNDSTDSNDDDDILESEIDVQSNFSLMKSGFNDFDEFNYFKHVICELYKNHSGEMDSLISQLSEKSQKALRGLVQVRKIMKDDMIIHRKIVHAKRRGGRRT